MTIEQKETLWNYAHVEATSTTIYSWKSTRLQNELPWQNPRHRLLKLFIDTIGWPSLNRVQLSMDLSNYNKAFSNTKSKTSKHIIFNELPLSSSGFSPVTNICVLALVLVQILLILQSTSQMIIVVTIFTIIRSCSAIFVAIITDKHMPLFQYKGVFRLAVRLISLCDFSPSSSIYFSSVSRWASVKV